MMRKRNNNMRNNNGGQQGRSNGGGRRYNNGGGGHRSGGANDGQNLQRQKQHATQQREKFMNMARDAQNNGDRVDVEYYMQHVEHYGRVLTDIQVIENERFASQREQQPQASHEQGDSQAQASSGDESQASVSGNEGSSESTPVEMGNQPRMTQRGRQPRSHFSAPIEERNREQASDATNHDAENNSGDIPLPGSILPII